MLAQPQTLIIKRVRQQAREIRSFDMLPEGAGTTSEQFTLSLDRRTFPDRWQCFALVKRKLTLLLPAHRKT